MNGSAEKAQPPRHYLDAGVKAVDESLGLAERDLIWLFGKANLDDSLADEVSARLRNKIGALRHLRADLAEVPSLRDDSKGRQP